MIDSFGKLASQSCALSLTENGKSEKKGNKEGAIPPKDDEPRVDVKTLPFPQRFIRRNLDKQFGKFLDYLKDITITIPFMEAIRDMPAWGKFLKDIINHKSKLEDYGLVSLVEESKAMYSKSPPKLKDPGSFTVPYSIGGTHFDKALFDIGASVSLMPYFIYKKLDLDELKPTNMCLSLADKSVTYPLGILENVPIKVRKFVIPVDFIVLEMEEDLEIPILFGRPFLRTTGAIIDMKKGKITLEVANECMEFDVLNIMKSTLIEVASRIDFIDECIEEVIHECLRNDLKETCITKEASEQILEVTPYLPSCRISRFEPLRREEDPKGTTLSEEVTLELKPLPSNLRYAFLDSNLKFPFIVNSSLPSNNVDALYDELNSHKNAIGYSINDLKVLVLIYVCIEFF